MTYIRCPECGQKALSVATQCPKCGYVLTQNPMESGGERGLVECRACHKMIPRGVPECPYCGYTGRSAVWHVLAVTAVIALAVGVGLGVWWLIAGTSQSTAAPATAPPAFVPSTPEPGAADTAPPRPDTAVGDSAGEAAPGRGFARDTAAAAAPDTPAAAEQPAVRLVVRWTDNWVNLREGPGTGYRIARVIQPGVRVEVSAPSRGWWPVWEAGEIVGYVAGSELTTTAPGTTR